MRGGTREGEGRGVTGRGEGRRGCGDVTLFKSKLAAGGRPTLRSLWGKALALLGAFTRFPFPVYCK